MESSSTIAPNVEYFLDNLDFVTPESDEELQSEEFESDEDLQSEEFESKLRDCEEISKLDEKDQEAVDSLINKFKKCCINHCIEKVSPNLLQSLVLESLRMDKNQRRYSMMLLMASKPCEKRICIRDYQLPYFGTVCRSFFQTFWICGRVTVDNVNKWIQERKSMLPRPHGNTGRPPKITLSTETVDKAKSFINWMGERHGEALAV
ncbi:31183_t:CDS:1, partial [Gigaspora margarita]